MKVTARRSMAMRSCSVPSATSASRSSGLVDRSSSPSTVSTPQVSYVVGVIVIVAIGGVSPLAPQTEHRPGQERVVASIGAVGTPAFGPVSVTVPATPNAIDVLRSVAGVVAGRTPMGFDRVDDLRLAVSEAAGRLIQAAGGVGTIREVVAIDHASVRIDLTMPDAEIGR